MAELDQTFGAQGGVIFRQPPCREQEQRLGIKVCARSAAIEDSQSRIEATLGLAIQSCPAVDHNQPVDSLWSHIRQQKPCHSAYGMTYDMCALDSGRIKQGQHVGRNCLQACILQGAITTPCSALVESQDAEILGQGFKIGRPVAR